MRFLIVDTCYPAFLASHYAATRELETRPYAEQWRALMATFFGTADSYSHHLRKLGYEAHEVVVNCVPLQAAWAREHRSRRSLRRRALVLDQADWLEADIVYVQDLSALPPRTLDRLRRGRMLVGQIASAPPEREQLRPFDLIVTSFPHFDERFRRLGVDSSYLPLAFDTRVLEALEPSRRVHGVVFVGALGRTQHTRGNAVLERAAARTQIDFWGYNAVEWPAASAIRSRYHGEAWGIEMYRVLAGARIALNRHIDVAADYANNMRLYEATGVGTMLLTDDKRNLRELFEPGREVVTYSGEDELVERIEHYLANDAAREALAQAGQKRTWRDHPYATRMQQLAELLMRRGA